MKLKSIIIVIIVGMLGCGYNKIVTETVSGCKVIALEDQQVIKKTSTSRRYLVVCQNETFVCASNALLFKFNNSDIFYRLKKDSTYRFKVSGIGKTFFTDYRNIIEIR